MKSHNKVIDALIAATLLAVLASLKIHTEQPVIQFILTAAPGVLVGIALAIILADYGSKKVK